jgi:FkbM family methyltransferase
MTKLLDHIRHAIRAAARPLVAVARRALTPPLPVTRLEFVAVEFPRGANCQMLLPVPSALATDIASKAYEQDCASIVEQLIDGESVCYDIGGHYGFYTLLFASLAKNGQVHTFEPVPALADCIRQSVEASRLSHVTVHQQAIACDVGNMALRYAASDQSDDSMAFLVEYGGVNTARSQVQYANFAEINAPVVTLDSLQIPSPNFIKIDAEGAEAFILRGGKRLLSGIKPRMLIELHGVDLALQCADILGDLGYLAIAVSDRALMMPVLWIHQQDELGLQIVQRHLGPRFAILFGASSARRPVD